MTSGDMVGLMAVTLLLLLSSMTLWRNFSRSSGWMVRLGRISESDEALSTSCVPAAGWVFVCHGPKGRQEREARREQESMAKVSLR